ncbi:uncharacterized protein RCO7_05324 [Rhynchosporium graminicola]|uniref:Heterokaryon incompatibility domain-containing protein n=1 Tax=Rhynchosporium graminicola TaxID=2792576 RepID=A0A1E1L3L9_9HELO|nr:uncharacterized protein RCO7_05324 [Rhynchosporium commune]
MSLYNPLDDGRDEIRLLTLLPKLQRTRGEVVQCELEIRSLSDFNSQYQAFSADFPPSNESRSTINWIRSSSQSEGSIEDLSPTPNREPLVAHHRFNWGDYAALSYVWGDESKTRSIIVNGRELKVTRNLEEALRAFRERSEFQSKFGLWADAICINQNDFEERGRQVTKMREIYGKAWTVIAWLGVEGNQSDMAIELVRKLCRFRNTQRTSFDLALKLTREPGYLGIGCWHALMQLMERPYWHRLWIIQEMVMGASSVVIRCGTSAIDWTSFCLGIEILQEDLWLVKDKLLQRDVAKAGGVWQNAGWSTTSLHLVYRDLSGLSQQIEQRENGPSFWKLIDIANSADCRDSRDKVYGLIGLMSVDLAKEIVPDYTIDPHDVYTEVSKAFIQIYKSLDPLREANPWGPTNTPSWVADWMWDGGRLSLARIENRLWGPAWLSGNSIPDASVYKPFEAARGSTSEMTFTNSRLLTCTGFVVDSIAGFSARGRGFFAWSKSTIVQAMQWKSIYGDFAETSKALFRTLVADRVGGGEKACDRHVVILNLPSNFKVAEPQFKQRGWTWLARQEFYYFRWEEWRKANKDLQLGDCRLDDFFSDEIPLNASEYDFTEVYACFDRTCQKRRFTLTKNGYMGWVPDNIHGSARDQTRKGDLIAILLGCSTPIVIRPSGQHFQVIGEAYIQGLMDSEGMEFLTDGKLEKQSFVFC